MDIIRLTTERAEQLAAVSEKLVAEGKAPTTGQALRLLEVATLQEIKEELSSIDSQLDSLNAELTTQ